MNKAWVWLWVLLLSACASDRQLLKQQDYRISDRKQYYALMAWSFDGRLAITSAQDSWSANISWRHQRDYDELELSGPLGQGAVKIRVDKEQVQIDQGKNQIERSSDIDNFVERKLGVFVPVRSLAKWVTGVPNPEMEMDNYPQGFVQQGWKVSYKEWLTTQKNWVMPKKIFVNNDVVRLKMVINEWGQIR